MRNILIFAIGVASFCLPAAAHEVWVERDGAGAPRIYLGEPAEIPLEGGEPEFHRFKAPLVFHTNPSKTLRIARQADHLEVKGAKKGDIRVKDDSIFDPWSEDEVLHGAVYYARAGRLEPQAKMALEIVPAEANSDRFKVMFKGEALADADVLIMSEGRWTKKLKTSADGELTAPEIGAGRYLMTTEHRENASAQIGGKTVGRVVHISTLTFVQE